ncbi:hypothetical protein Back2_19960 [Nocardioides baekrokdamisoli]|uniref:Xaa-Pro dipeptidyl-peptidase C-terminal domain-containing protein n=1 Tax=Nocardioides baekrokdamisoli TaxID=1804624 RepID=A0A3G9J3X0_9ACTN|nr:hypothetical protein Back2_19960 [Nocardioides baekrokdamisoli]
MTCITAASFAAIGGLAGAAPSHADTAAYTQQTLHFAVTVGPNNDVKCDIVGDLYLPTGASSANPVPAILATNGFGGSKDDLAAEGKAFAGDGYAFLAYSGLGFGSADGLTPPTFTPGSGSTCQITLDDPDWDGKAGSQLVSYLGGAPGIAYLDSAHTQPAPALTAVTHKAHDHNGVAQQYDPVVGMIGGSYGGEIQFAVAEQDARVDTIVPMITWNDLNYSLDPNNTASTGSGVQTSTPGAAKLFWAAGFSAEGAIVDGIAGAQAQPSRLLPCPNFAAWVCPALANAVVTGALDSTSAANLHHASVASYVQNIKIPTLLMQGQNDTLFNLNEATATYQALKANHVPVKMIWHSWGHSHGTPAPGEMNLADLTPGQTYETDRVVAWFDHYLKGADTNLGPNFAYFRDWVSYSGNAAPAYATSNQFPVGGTNRYYLGTNALTSTAPLLSGSQTFLTTVAGLPTSTNPLDVLSAALPLPIPEIDLNGTSAQWNTAALSSPLTVVGSPVVHLSVSDPLAALTQGTGPIGQLVVFVRLQDVAPNGTASDIYGSIAPIRVPNVNAPFTVTMPGIVHQFAAGHTLRLIVAGGSTNYRGGTIPTTVTITGGAGQTLDLPTTP